MGSTCIMFKVHLINSHEGDSTECTRHMLQQYMAIALSLKVNTQLDSCLNSMSPLYHPEPKQDKIARSCNTCYKCKLLYLITYRNMNCWDPYFWLWYALMKILLLFQMKISISFVFTVELSCSIELLTTSNCIFMWMLWYCSVYAY